MIQKPEYDSLIKAGMVVTLNWEFYATDWNASGAITGHAQGVEACRQARLLGYPLGNVIVGSADFDMSLLDWHTSGRFYAAAFCEAVIAAGYMPGVYGPYDVLQRCYKETSMGFFWQAGLSTAWSDGRNSQWWPNANARQDSRAIIGGVAVDLSDIINPNWNKETDVAFAKELLNIATAVAVGATEDGYVTATGPDFAKILGSANLAAVEGRLTKLINAPTPVTLSDAQLQQLSSMVVAELLGKLRLVQEIPS